jgi:outer membrane protein OmpA-like peptidoglycan-associated protein
MTFPVNCAQPRSAGAFVQGWRARGWPTQGWRAGSLARLPWVRCIALLALGIVSGCSNYHQKGPEAWYHENVGGAISNQRPSPPGQDDPYPNLATVPPKPPPADVGAWNRMTAGLMTDRVNARQAAALAPIPAPASAAVQTPATPAATHKTPQPTGAQPQPPPVEQPGASAALVGASAPPAASSPAKRSVAAPFAVPADTRPPPILSSAAAAQLVANGQLPPLPAQEPPRPDIAPAPPAPAVPITATPPVVAPPPHTGGDQVDFDRGSAKLLDPALARVKALAAERGDRGIAITGYGDATSAGASEQSDALGLGLSRAQSLATALVAQGVPFARLRLNAESAGRGASLRLLE